MTNNSKRSSAFFLAAFVGAIGGFAFWAVFLYFIFVFPDAQGGIALVISPFCSAIFGLLLSIAVWGLVSRNRGEGVFLAFLAIFLMIILLFMVHLRNLAAHASGDRGVTFKRSHAILAVVFFLFLLLLAIWVKGFWLTEVFHTRKSNEPNRRAVLQIREAIEIGASHAGVLAAFWQHRTDDLRLFVGTPTDWSITMPLEFGASDWYLGIKFRDGRVTAVRVRTSNGPPPGDGPQDKLKESSQ